MATENHSRETRLAPYLRRDRARARPTDADRQRAAVSATSKPAERQIPSSDRQARSAPPPARPERALEVARARRASADGGDAEAAASGIAKAA